jgi:hypothetical protein
MMPSARRRRGGGGEGEDTGVVPGTVLAESVTRSRVGRAAVPGSAEPASRRLFVEQMMRELAEMAPLPAEMS